jgi:hypothetical protein
MSVTQRKYAKNTSIVQESTSPVKQQKRDGPVTVLPKLLDFYTTFLANISIFKPRPLQEAGSFIVTAWFQNVTIYTNDLK